MFSFVQRFQNVSNQAFSMGIVMVVFIMVSSYYQLINNNAFSVPSNIDNVKTLINVRTSRYFGSQRGKAKENMKIKFDLNTDLTPLFNWNTKQVFVYLTAEYNSTEKITSEVTFWDKIIKSKDDAVIDVNDLRSKYSIWDIEDGKFEGKDLVFKLHWNVQPWVGLLTYGETVGNYTLTVENKNKV
ncbi:BAQ_1a_G0035510.mRNA.1.CDS.1 [Saccharomyces cerevisiae]|nr:BAQ_1a_G0035510.mRNA.1.CDS.1 [Saccharomyces cerevisiae]CAI4638364.1 BAM_G0035530.mRNA.1.CDS.1 [Saccharomyces cerevisiae]CAI7223962.1 BAM_G0035530.mRNA.1.CDS.1 [Saccharomyces cerevisiae]CAI7224787.1 BAQ_1a_G0035510.mRNA.1.CDS.1 [Saccharomyces cerevisiae]